MDLYNLMMKIPYMILLLLAITFVYMMFFGGLGNLQEEIDQTQQNNFRRAVVMENLLSVKLTEEQHNQYYSDRPNLVERRAILSQQFFLQGNEIQNPDQYQEIPPGYSTENGHCYIPKVAGLDGEIYGFYIEMTEDVDDPPNLGCDTPQNPTRAISSPALLLRGGSSKGGGEHEFRVPVRLYVYQINTPDYLED